MTRLLFFIFLALEWGHTSFAGPVLPDFADAVLRITYQTEDATVLGSGFFISPHGELITNLHVMSAFRPGKGRAVVFSTRDGRIWREFKMGSCKPEKGLDICHLKLEAHPKAWLKLGVPLPAIDSKIFTVGNSADDSFVRREGKYLGVFPFENLSQVQISIPLKPGMSGSPIFTEDGSLVGVVTQILPGAPNARYLGISARDVLRLVESSENFRTP